MVSRAVDSVRALAPPAAQVLGHIKTLCETRIRTPCEGFMACDLFGDCQERETQATPELVEGVLVHIKTDCFVRRRIDAHQSRQQVLLRCARACRSNEWVALVVKQKRP